MPQMIYADMHCDSVTCACVKGESLSAFGGQINSQKLKTGGCAVQCFALFTEGRTGAGDFERFLAFYNIQIAIDPLLCPVYRYCDIENAVKSGKIGAVLTVENLGFIGKKATAVDDLARAGVKMASLVWNNANALAYPNLVKRDGRADFSLREARGLTALGKSVIERLNERRIIIDVSHLSDGGVADALEISKAPVVASHSNCAEVCGVSRNLTDSQLKKIAEKGGAVGLNFCRKFLSAGDDAHGAEVFDLIYRHYINMVNAGGEDLPAIGGDFDGIPVYPEMADCTRVQEVLNYLSLRGVNGRALDKFAFGNFARVFGDVAG